MPTKKTIDVVLKCYTDAETVVSELTAALEKNDRAQHIKRNVDGTVGLVYEGTCEDLTSLEASINRAGVPALILNHVHLVVALNPDKDGDVKKAQEAIGDVKGVLGLEAKGRTIGLHANLTELDIQELEKAAQGANCGVTINKTYEYVTCKLVEGEWNTFVQAAIAIKGVMRVNGMGENTLGVWIHKGLLSKRAFDRIKGVKVEVQSKKS
ncbi:MAG: hypothetical protein HY716_02200 [Planctomycetes bacterium]|nr:hypothetical protein [Planctomycetota bacterium]